jgi:TolB-like protein
MGEVYRAYDEQLGRDVAIKVLPADQLGDATARARLLREARSVAALNHPHICTVYEVSESDGQAYIAMELIDGKPVSVPLPKEQVLRYGQEIADALAHAHERGIVHRDLKCGNVMVTSDDRVKILDFGLAKRLDSNAGDGTTEELITKRGSVMGTLAYMAPEQLRGANADVRSDIWALGVMLYEMSTGERPFKGQTQFELVSSILNDRCPAAPPVIQRCLEKDPARRYQSARDVRAALESGPTAIRRPKLWIAAAIALAIAAVAPFVKLPHYASKIQSLAVLPLENLSGDPNQEYFADGITDALITELGKIRGLSRVIARSTVMQFKGSKKPPAQIAKELDVDALLTGSVIRSGDRVRVTAALVNPSTGAELWSGRFEHDLRDVLSLQSEVARAIILEITGKLTPEEKERLQKTHTVNPAAYEDYLKGRYYLRGRLNPQDVASARVYFERALKEDPDYGVAMMGLADAISSPAQAGRVPATDVFPRARALVEQTLAREPDLAEARDLNARFLFVWDWDCPRCRAGVQKGHRAQSELSRCALCLFTIASGPWPFRGIGRRSTAGGGARSAEFIFPIPTRIPACGGGKVR